MSTLKDGEYWNYFGYLSCIKFSQSKMGIVLTIRKNPSDSNLENLKYFWRCKNSPNLVPISFLNFHLCRVWEQWVINLCSKIVQFFELYQSNLFAAWLIEIQIFKYKNYFEKTRKNLKQISNKIGIFFKFCCPQRIYELY